MASIVDPRLGRTQHLKKLEVSARMRERCRQFVTNLRAHPDAIVFLKPVDTVLYRDYLDVVKKPMDLGYIGRRWRDRALWYDEFSVFGHDMRLMIDNALLYNNRPLEDAEVRGIAYRVSVMVEQFIQEVYADPNRAAPRQPRTGEGDVFEDEPVEVALDWVQCDRCNKWRKLPAGLPASVLHARWTCADSTWDSARASCDSPEEKEEDGGRPATGPGSRGGKGKAGRASTSTASGGVSSASPAVTGQSKKKRKSEGGAGGAGGGDAGAAPSAAGSGIAESGEGGPDGPPTAVDGGASGGAGGGGGPEDTTGKKRKKSEGGAGGAKKPRRAPVPKGEGVRLADKCGAGSPEAAFWAGVERTWDEMGLFGNSRKAPVLFGRGVDLLDFYARVVRGGGYDVVHGTQGGWSGILRQLAAAAGVAGPIDNPTANKLRKAYEKQLIEYERRCGVGWTHDTLPAPSPLLATGFVHVMAGCGVPSSPSPIGPPPVPSEGYKPPVTALGEGSGGGAGTAAGGGEESVGALAQSKRLKMLFAASGTAGGWGASESGRTAPGGTLLDPAGHGMPLGIRLPYEWRAPEAVPLLTRSFLMGVLPEPAPAPPGKAGVGGAGGGGVGGLDDLTGPPLAFVYPSAASESDMNWAMEHTAHILGSTRYGTPALGRGKGNKGHFKMCMMCRDTRRVMLPLGSAAAFAAAAAAGKAAPVVEGEEEEEDEEMEGASKPLTGGVPGDGGEDGMDEEGEGGGEDDGQGDADYVPETTAPVEGVKKKTWIRRRAAPLRAWAVCGGCKNIACLPCLMPTPAAAGLRTEAERLRLLTAAADASCKRGACTPTGKKLELSDVGLWFCPECTRGRKAGGYADAPFCSGCCGALDGPPQWQHSMFDLAALQRAPTAVCPTSDWPSAFKCDACGGRAHGECAWKAGGAAVTVTALGGEGGSATGVRGKRAYVCCDCKASADPAGTGLVTFSPALSGLERSSLSTAHGPGNGLVLVTLAHPVSRATLAVGQLASEHERVPPPAPTPVKPAAPLLPTPAKPTAPLTPTPAKPAAPPPVAAS